MFGCQYSLVESTCNELIVTKEGGAVEVVVVIVILSSQIVPTTTNQQQQETTTSNNNKQQQQATTSDKQTRNRQHATSDVYVPKFNNAGFGKGVMPSFGSTTCHLTPTYLKVENIENSVGIDRKNKFSSARASKTSNVNVQTKRAHNTM